MENYYYILNKGELSRFRIEQDEYPWNPRTEQDGNLGHMMIWWNRYSLGDKNDYSNPEDCINDLVRENISDKTLINYVRNGNASNNLEIIYNRSDMVYELCGDYRVWWNGGAVHHGELNNAPEIDWLVDDIIYALPITDKIKLLEKKGFFFMDIYGYEHSGITISCSRCYPYTDRWDGGQAGFIYTTKKEILDSGCMMKGKKKFIKITERNWKKAAETFLEGEVKEYDMYLCGEVYGYIKEKYDGEDYIEDDSCWGYYSEKWGDELAEEIAKEAFCYDMIVSEDEAVEIEREITEKMETETMACYV